MSKKKLDFDDYEEKSVYDGDAPKKGIYDGALVQVDDHTSSAGNDGYEWIFKITEEPYVGWRGYVYSNMDSAKWKTQQIVLAITGSKKPFVIDTTQFKDIPGGKVVAKAKPVRLRIANETYDDEVRGKIRTVMPMERNDKGDDDEGYGGGLDEFAKKDDGDGDAPEEKSDDNSSGKASKKKKKKKGDDGDPWKP